MSQPYNSAYEGLGAKFMELLGPNKTITVIDPAGNAIEAVVTSIEQHFGTGGLSESISIEWAAIGSASGLTGTAEIGQLADQTGKLTVSATSMSKAYEPYVYPTDGYFAVGTEKPQVEVKADLSQIEADLAKMPKPEGGPIKVGDKADLLTSTAFIKATSGFADLNLASAASGGGDPGASPLQTFAQKLKKPGGPTMKDVVEAGKLMQQYGKPIGKVTDTKVTDEGFEGVVTVYGKPIDDLTMNELSAAMDQFAGATDKATEQAIEAGKALQSANDKQVMAYAMTKAMEELFLHLSPDLPSLANGDAAFVKQEMVLPHGQHLQVTFTVQQKPHPSWLPAPKWMDPLPPYQEEVIAKLPLTPSKPKKKKKEDPA